MVNKVTPCGGCPCLNSSYDECECNLGYSTTYYDCLGGSGIASINCGLTEVLCLGGTYRPPESVEVEERVPTKLDAAFSDIVDKDTSAMWSEMLYRDVTRKSPWDAIKKRINNE